MAQIITFDAFEEPELDGLDREGLLACLAQIKERIAALDEKEPRNMMSEEYELWGERHEELEDIVDEILERLDEL